MRIGLSCDLKEAVPAEPGGPDDAFEEYDSPKTIQIIVESLESKGHSVVVLGGGPEFLDNIRREKVDIVFNIAEGRGSYRSREAQVPSVLEMLDIPFTGSDPQCLAISLDKTVTKKLAITFGVSTPKWLTINNKAELERDDWSEIPFPAIVKPAYEGSSKGIRLTSLTHNVKQAQQEASRILESYRQPVMIEEFIDGDEVTVGIIGNSSPRIVGMMRIIPRKKDSPFVYSLEVKRDYVNLVDYECPARLGQEVLDKMTAASLNVFKGLGCRDFARIDFRIGREGVPYFLEVNPLPGLGTYSDLVIMAIKMGWTHQKLIGAVLDAALERCLQCVST
ncbi:MAG: ATP-grasp domain-containing protein [Chloroflexota bacterium]